MSELTEGQGRSWIDDPRPEPVEVGPEFLRYRDAAGVLCKAELETGSDFQPQRGRLRARHVHIGGQPMIQKYVPEDVGRLDPTSYDVLDAEVRALSRLAGVYVVQPPAELPRLVGYNVDVAEPFLLLEPYRGRPVTSAVLRGLGPPEKLKFQRSLLRAVYLVEQARLEHGAVGLDALWWDEKIAVVMLTDFEQAGIHKPTEYNRDIIGAGKVIRQVALGPDAQADMRRDPEFVRELLRGVLIADPAGPVPLKALMQRLGMERPTDPIVDPTEAYKAGWDEFDRTMATRRGELTPRGMPVVDPSSASHEVVPAGDSGSSNKRLIISVLVVLVIVAVVVVVLLVQGVIK